MVALNFDATRVEPNSRPDPVPTNWYPVAITGSETKPTKAGTGSYLELTLTIQSGEFSGRKAFARLNLNNPNQTAVDIAYAELSAICHCVGVVQVQDSQQLHGRPFCAMIKKEERDDKPGEFTNTVDGYKDAQGNDPGMGGNAGAQTGAAPAWTGAGAAQQPAAQQEQTSAGAGGGAPWQQNESSGQAAASNAGAGAGQAGAAPPWAQQ